MSLVPLSERCFQMNHKGSFLILFFHQNGTEDLHGNQKFTWAFFIFLAFRWINTDLCSRKQASSNLKCRTIPSSSQEGNIIIHY